MLAGKTLFITGASRGIGLAIALRAARDGANIAIAAKTETPDPRLPGTIHSAAEEIEKAGGKALAIRCDIRKDDDVQAAVDSCVARFGGIDICVNNASAISLTGTLDTPLKRFDLMHDVNTRGTWVVTRACLPHLLKSSQPHVLMLSPPLNMKPRWFAGHGAYTMAKYGMSLCVLGMAAEFAGKMAVNALWPRTAIATSAIRIAMGGDGALKQCRTPDILADAAWHIFQKRSDFSGRFLIDDSFLYDEGVRDFDRYRVDPSCELAGDLFVPEDSVPPPGASLSAKPGGNGTAA